MNSVLFLFLRRIRSPLLLLIAVYAISIGVLVLIPGVDADGNVWYFDFFHAFYFVSFMGTTIGFGEIPHAFSDAQRAWVMVCVYLTVISWLYGIGQIIALLQDPAFRNAIAEQRFRLSIKRIREPYYIVAGAGVTGSLLAKALASRGLFTAVIDKNDMAIIKLVADESQPDVPHLTGDASAIETLEMAGLRSDFCQGVVAVTDSDDVNVKIAISSKLLNPQLQTVARASSTDAVVNLQSFDNDYSVNPFSIFAEYLCMAIERPHVYQLHRILGTIAHQAWPQYYNPPTGKWILAGYGRCGQEVHKAFTQAGIETSIIEPLAERAPVGAVIGRGVDAGSLAAADIRNAVGIIADSNNDANNLSIVVTAKQLNPNVYTVARLNDPNDLSVFKAANIDMVMDANRIIVWRMLPFLTDKNLYNFFTFARQQSDGWAKPVVEILKERFKRTPRVWTCEITESEYGELTRRIQANVPVTWREWLKHENESVALMLANGDDAELLPDLEQTIRVGDRLLLASTQSEKRYLRWRLKQAQLWLPKLPKH